MSWNERRVGHRKQPAGLPRASAAWRSRGLVALFDTRLAVELIHNNRATVATSTLATSNGGAANGAEFTGTASQQYAHRAAYSTLGPMTLVILLDVDTLTNYGAIIAKQGTAISNCPYELRVGGGSTDGGINLLRASGSSYGNRTVSGGNLLDAGNKLVRLIVRMSEADIEPIGSVFVNGARTDFGGSPVGTAPTDNVLAEVWIGRRSDGATQLDGQIYFIGLFNRAITDAEAMALSSNPWLLYERRPSSAFRAAAAGAGFARRYYFDMVGQSRLGG